jgi:hypothetical protein
MQVATFQARVDKSIAALAVGLLLYLPLEAAVVAHLSGTVYWAVRLAPDALIAVACAAVLLVPQGRRREALVVLWGLAVTSLLVVVLNDLRGQSASDAINGIRVVLRYAVLGALLLATVKDPTSMLRWATIVVAGMAAVQVAIALVQFGQMMWPMVSGAEPFSDTKLLGVSGTLGRYDRLGFLMVGTLLLAMLGAIPGPTWIRRGLPILALVGLAISTSRQAMLGLALAAGLLAILPRLPRNTRALRLGTAVAVVLIAVLLPLHSPSSATTNPDAIGDTPTGPAPTSTVSRGSTLLSLDPNLNFRLYYSIRFLPWAIVQEPLLGFGPLQEASQTPDPRLKDKLERDGMAWSWARRFMTDSDYVSLVVQFGVILPLMFLGFLGWIAVTLLRWVWSGRDDAGPWPAFGLAYAVAVLIGAFFGPTLEIRTVSILLWVGLFGGLIAIRYRQSGVS